MHKIDNKMVVYLFTNSPLEYAENLLLKIKKSAKINGLQLDYMVFNF